MLIPARDSDHIAALHLSHLPVQHEHSFSFNYVPCFGTMIMKLVTYTLTRFQGNDFGQGVYSILHNGAVKHPICAPAALFVHGSGGNRVNERLQRFALLFVAHQNTVGTCGHDSVIYSIYEKRNIKLVNGMDIGTIGTQRGVSQSMVVECSRKGVPCSKLFHPPL